MKINSQFTIHDPQLKTDIPGCSTCIVNRALCICLCFMLCALGIVTAQRFRAGITGGLTCTDVGAFDPVDHDNDFHKLGYVFGGYVNTSISANSALQFELNLIEKGSLQNPDSNNMNYSKLVLNYVEIPIIYKYHIAGFLSGSKNAEGPFDIQGGISIGQLVHSSIVGDSVSQNPDMSFLNKTDVSLLIGLNYNFSEHLCFCLRYSNSVIPAIKSNSYPFSYSPPISTINNGNNMVWHFMFQYTFGSAKETTAKD